MCGIPGPVGTRPPVGAADRTGSWRASAYRPRAPLLVAHEAPFGVLRGVPKGRRNVRFSFRSALDLSALFLRLPHCTTRRHRQMCVYLDRN